MTTYKEAFFKCSICGYEDNQIFENDDPIEKECLGKCFKNEEYELMAVIRTVFLKNLEGIVYCSECAYEHSTCLKYDLNPYEQEWGHRCGAKEIEEIMDPADLPIPRRCKSFVKKGELPPCKHENGSITCDKGGLIGCKDSCNEKECDYFEEGIS